MRASVLGMPIWVGGKGEGRGEKGRLGLAAGGPGVCVWGGGAGGGSCVSAERAGPSPTLRACCAVLYMGMHGRWLRAGVLALPAYAWAGHPVGSDRLGSAVFPCATIPSVDWAAQSPPCPPRSPSYPPAPHPPLLPPPGV